VRIWILAALVICSTPALAQEQVPQNDYSYKPSYTPPVAQTRLVPPNLVKQWHDGRRLYGVGSIVGLVGAGLSLTSTLIVIITGYPCDPNDPIHMINPSDTCNMNGMMYQPPKPTDAVPLLAYIGSTTSAFGFVLSASGLGLQHHVLHEMGADINRGVFAGGTALGVLGFMSVGASYFFGLTSYLNPHDQGIAILASSITGMGLCVLGGLLYTIDAGHTKRAWEKLGTF
jgi:hypothetical protein